MPTTEEQRIVQELDMPDEDAVPGRHRAPASALRRTAVRGGIGALGVLLAVGLGIGTADLLGLDDAGQPAAYEAPRPLPLAVEEEPRAGRGADRTVRPTLPVPPPAPSATAAPDPSPAAAPAPAAPPVPGDGTAAQASLPTVRTGDSCASVGQAATTARGNAAVCTASPGKGPNKWRAV